MVCARCQTQVPDESAFCLRCGARLLPAARLVPVNGGGALPTAPATAAEAGAPAGHPARAAAQRGTGDKQAYALSFKPIVDERVRYRVARWVCEHAPAHTLSEVQADLMRGAFFTFLALAPADVEATRRGLQGLGVAPALVSLAPATSEMLVPERPGPPRPGGPRRITRRDWIKALVTVTLLCVFGLVALRMLGGRGF